MIGSNCFLSYIDVLFLRYILGYYQNRSSMENISELSNNSSNYMHDIKNRTYQANHLLTTEETTLICILSVFSVLGSLGNGLVLCIFKRKAGQHTATVFILALAGTDLIACLVVMPVVISATILRLQFRFDFLCKFYFFLITSIVPLSSFIMVAIGVDRYLCICHPFVRLMTVKRAKIIVGILVAFVTVLGIIPSLSIGVDENSGICYPSTAILPSDFVHVYQKIYTSLFLILLVIVLVLYGMIFRSVLIHRAKKRLLKREQCYSLTEESMVSLNNKYPGAQSPNNTAVMIEMNHETGSVSVTYQQIDHSEDKASSSNRRALSRSSTKVEKESDRLANIKTAMILFVVTAVFIVAFLPSWLIGNKWVKGNIIVYHIFFLYNVANPFIYAFMNRVFREDVVKMIKSCTSCFYQ